MQEDFLHYIWKFRLFDHAELSTADGTELEVLNPGMQNLDSGPDFFNAKIILNDTTWAGNVEIHWFSSEWKRHGHQLDPAYQNVILHVVYENDEEVFTMNGDSIPVLELKHRISADLIHRYQSFLAGQKWIPCAHLIHTIKPEMVYPFLQRIMIEKLEEKSILILRSWENNQRNWEQTFFEYLSRNFGFSVNALPFQLLAQSISIQDIAKHKNNLMQIEAILFGQAGLLNENFEDDYPNFLKKEYAHLKKKFSLDPLSGHLWKFSKMRPANFPTIRIAQLAQLIHHSSALFSKLMEMEDLKLLRKLLDVELQGYWQNHYGFDKPSSKKIKSLGESSVDILLINTIIPFLFVYGEHKQDEVMKNRALLFLEQIKPEQNHIVKKWEELGVKAYHASETQALLHLKKRYCSAKKCLTCGIGNQLLIAR